MRKFQPAPVNTVRMLFPVENFLIADLVNNFDRFISVTARSRGYFWRKSEDNHNATAGFKEKNIKEKAQNPQL